MNRSVVQRKAASYRVAQQRLAASRRVLRREVVAWKDRGATIVEIADALGWSRQSVYDLIGDW